MKRVYGALEGPFRRLFARAERGRGITGENLMVLLESRFDNIIYRMGFATSRAEARQLIRHGHFTVNGKKVWTPSFRVRPGDVVGWREKTSKLDFYQDVVKRVGQRPLPAWLSLDKGTMSAEVLRIPDLGDVDSTIETRLIVEHYSR